jgi:hypothetical protein
MTLEAADLSKVDIALLEALPRKLDLVTQFHDSSCSSAQGSGGSAAAHH